VLRFRWTSLVLSSAIASVALSQTQTLKATLYHTFTGHTGPGRQAVFSPDGTLLATASVDRTVKLWHLPDGKLTGVLTNPEGITSIAFSPDGLLLATGSSDDKIRLWAVR